MRFFKFVSSVLLVSSVLIACDSVDFRKTSGGIPYKIFSKNGKDSIKEGYFVKLEVIRKSPDTVFFSSYSQGQAVYLQVQKQPGAITYSNLALNIPEILLRARKGDSIYIVQSTDSLLKDPQQAMGLKKGQELVTTIRVVDVYKTREETDQAYFKDQIPTKAEIEAYNTNMKKNFQTFLQDSAAAASLQKDQKTIEAYLSSRKINARKSEWGFYVEELAPGSGAKPEYKQFTNVKYKGMHLDGKSFDEGTYPVQIGVAQVVPGFMFGITEIRKGGKARIYIPSVLAYGTQGNPPKVAPNEILVFEIELLEVSDMPLPQPQQPMQPQSQQPHSDH
jgi:FKBP-type peptidyl-prolyl cis-trans isomerase FkpA